MPKKTITKPEYHQLVGLMALAERHNRSLEEIEKAAAEIVGEPQEYDGPGGAGAHTSDEIYGRSCSADDLLKRLGIVVRKR